jgi:hypothetical protein
MAELELSALAPQGLNRRIGDMATFTTEATVWSDTRHNGRQTVRWAFTTRDARRRLTHKYPMLQD